MKICEVCREESPKYRCPKCKIQYCSLKCYKEHKDTVCIKPQDDKENKIEPDRVAVSSRLNTESTHSSREDGEIWSDDSDQDQTEYMEEDEDKVSIESLRKLGESAELKSLLGNPHLRKLMTEVDDAENKDKAMQRAMQEPLFLEFADQCLQIVSDYKTENET
ncbi:zinc finger HIT domain-containing protein 3-like [Ptychodera flava]|uniref:zinc finger HIT domain-containing protein 3-like n=1 Tax=Ptychodera flava TaxID=63121 RepID=UPI00396A5287